VTDVRRGPFPIPDEILEGSNVDLVESLMSGSAILGDSRVDSAYGAFAMYAADTGYLSHVVSDVSMIYGTNLACDRLFYDSSHCPCPSPEDLRQLCGRVGRIGKCSRAELVLSPEDALRLVGPTTLAPTSDGCLRLMELFLRRAKSTLS
jgi:hypothetical protein